MTGLQDVSHRHEGRGGNCQAPVPKGKPILELRGLQKKYGAVEALKPANITFLSAKSTRSSAKTAPANRR